MLKAASAGFAGQLGIPMAEAHKYAVDPMNPSPSMEAFRNWDKGPGKGSYFNLKDLRKG